MRFILATATLLFPLTVWATPFTATYTFTGSPGDQVSEPVDAQPVGALFADIVRGPGVDPRDGANSINSFDWTSAATIDEDDYYGFTITPNAGFAVDVDRISFSERRSNQGILTFDLRSSLDAYATSLFTFVTPDNDNNRRHNVVLGAAFDDLQAPVTFRFFGYAAQDNLGTWRLGVSGAGTGPVPANLQVAGDIAAIPEPTSLLLLGSGIAGVVARKYRRRTPAASR
jgi:hypothetical protein